MSLTKNDARTARIRAKVQCAVRVRHYCARAARFRHGVQRTARPTVADMPYVEPISRTTAFESATSLRVCFSRQFIALTRGFANATPVPMQNRKTRPATYGPWLVGLGATLWGTESAWRIPLNELFDAKVIVFWEHVFILMMFLPILISQFEEIPRVRPHTWGFLVFSAFAGSAVGTVFFTLAL
jgi:hypothetical protein